MTSMRLGCIPARKNPVFGKIVSFPSRSDLKPSVFVQHLAFFKNALHCLPSLRHRRVLAVHRYRIRSRSRS